ncbi:MAG TPA: S8 family serine peptidase [Mycobacteriales bacterium]|nr:S8 family serine peptidase [Mycobacteriales bacterium]
MRTPRLLLAAAVTASIAAVPAVQAASPASPANPGSAHMGRYLLQLADGQRAATLEGRLTSLGVTSAVAFETINSLAITAPRSAVDALLRSGTAVAARPERKIKLHLAESVKYMGADRETLGKSAVMRTAAGKVERPSVDGTGQTVAVLDTGIADVHPDLLNRVTVHRNFELSYLADMLLDGSQLDTFAQATGDTARTDDIGHGTHVAGIVGGTGAAARARANNNRGVAPGAKMVDLRIAAGPVQGLVSDMGWERNAIAAFDWLLRHRKDAEFGANGIAIATNSWGLTPEDLFYGAPSYEPLAAIIVKLERAGVHNVFSAGNDGAADKVGDRTIPNGLPQVISVAASCKPDAIQENCDKATAVNDIGKFSSRGTSVDIAAPGVEIVSTVSPSVVGALSKGCAPDELGPVPCRFYRGVYGGKNATPADVAANYALYGSLHGTSMAAPHVAGALALILQANPKLTPTQMQTILAATAKDRQRKGRDIEAGWGLIDVPRALAAATQLKKGVPMKKIFPGFRWKSSL